MIIEFYDDSVSMTVVDGSAVLNTSLIVHEAVIDALEYSPFVCLREGRNDSTAVFPFDRYEGIGASE